MKREPKVKNKGKVMLFLLAAGGVFLVKLGVKNRNYTHDSNVV